MPMGYVILVHSPLCLYIYMYRYFGDLWHIGVGFRRCSFRREGNARASVVGRVTSTGSPPFLYLCTKKNNQKKH